MLPSSRERIFRYSQQRIVCCQPKTETMHVRQPEREREREVYCLQIFRTICLVLLRVDSLSYKDSLIDNAETSAEYCYWYALKLKYNWVGSIPLPMATFLHKNKNLQHQQRNCNSCSLVNWTRNGTWTNTGTGTGNGQLPVCYSLSLSVCLSVCPPVCPSACAFKTLNK